MKALMNIFSVIQAIGSLASASTTIKNFDVEDVFSCSFFLSDEEEELSEEELVAVLRESSKAEIVDITSLQKTSAQVAKGA